MDFWDICEIAVGAGIGIILADNGSKVAKAAVTMAGKASDAVKEYAEVKETEKA